MRQLHFNPSFNVDLSVMKESLHLLEPPPRKALISVVSSKDQNIAKRLVVSRKLGQKMYYARRIYACVLKWWLPIQRKNMIRKAIMEEKRRQEEENLRMGDDEWSKFRIK